MSLGLWCAGVELGGGGRREVKVKWGTCHADGLGAVKNKSQGWTEGPGDRVTSRGGRHFGTLTNASVHGGWTVLTKVEDGGDTRRVAGNAYEVRYSRAGLVVWAAKTIGGWLSGLGLKTRVQFRWESTVARGVIARLASRRS
jgi:hypothetical protein